MTKNEIITTAKCCIVDNCVSCPFAGHGNCITDFMNHILEYMKTEPAPAATGTSLEDEACTDIIGIYEGMSEREHRAFDIGEAYGKICSTRDKLDKLRGGDGNEH